MRAQYCKQKENPNIGDRKYIVRLPNSVIRFLMYWCILSFIVGAIVTFIEYRTKVDNLKDKELIAVHPGNQQVDRLVW